MKIQVDENPSYESEPLGAQTSADIYDPLYVGGLPPGTVTNPFIFLKNIKLEIFLKVSPYFCKLLQIKPVVQNTLYHWATRPPLIQKVE